MINTEQTTIAPVAENLIVMGPGLDLSVPAGDGFRHVPTFISIRTLKVSYRDCLP